VECAQSKGAIRNFHFHDSVPHTNPQPPKTQPRAPSTPTHHTLTHCAYRAKEWSRAGREQQKLHTPVDFNVASQYIFSRSTDDCILPIGNRIKCQRPPEMKICCNHCGWLCFRGAEGKHFFPSLYALQWRLVKSARGRGGRLWGSLLWAYGGNTTAVGVGVRHLVTPKVVSSAIPAAVYRKG
jgi:hypothetical protein